MARTYLDSHCRCVLVYPVSQGLCLVFEIRLYSLLFLFECTENLCNMNEHRKQKAALVLDMEQEKKETKGLIGLQLQSPPHSQVHHAMHPLEKFQSPATKGTRTVEVQPMGTPATGLHPPVFRSMSPEMPSPRAAYTNSPSDAVPSTAAVDAQRGLLAQASMASAASAQLHLFNPTPRVSPPRRRRHHRPRTDRRCRRDRSMMRTRRR
jgi:hypothetical protein